MTPHGNFREDAYAPIGRSIALFARNVGGEDYYNDNITKEMVDNFRNKTFKLDWSKDARSSSGMVVQFLSQETSFTPPALLD